MSASSVEDVLAGAMWVSGLTDPTLSIDRLHETFLEVIFSFPGDDADGERDRSARPQQRLRTAAEVERERKERERLRQEADELLGLGRPPDPFEADEEEDQPTEDDDMDDDEQVMEDQAFLDWIDNAQQVAHHGGRPENESMSTAVELELRRVGLGEAQEEAAADILPERLKEIEVKEKRPRLGAKMLPGGYTYSIPLELEAYWVLRQLRNAGEPLAHSTRICGLANRPLAEIADEPVLVAITFALRKMTREFVEPSQLMLYHQTELHPLLFPLLDGSSLMAAAEHSIPVSSLAYSTLTGRRQRPILSETFVGFTATSTASIGEGDWAWREVFGVDYTIRKPCFVELGRLLIRILELDSLCHKLEYRRQQMLIMLRDNTEARVQDQRSILENTVFESAVEADLWHSFVQSLAAGRAKGAFHAVRALGLEEAYEEYTITALQYQENLSSNAPINLCPRQPRLSVHAWAEQVGSVLSPPRPSEWVLALFNNAIVETFSKLPLLCKQVVDIFCSEGDLIVSYTTVHRKDDVFPLASFFVDHARHYVDLLQKERQGFVKLFYVLDDNLVRRVLNVHQLYQYPPPMNEDGSEPSEMEWFRERETAMELLVYRLADTLIAKVKSELVSQAVVQLDRASVQRLGLLCAQGPYEPTRLVLEAYTPTALTWEPEWNVVEALPLGDAGGFRGGGDDACPVPVPARPRVRVCAVVQGDNGITSFAFIDENGVVVGTTRWSECAMNSALGRAAALMQNITLEKLFVQCTPAVIAVAASGTGSLRVMRAMQEFVRDRVVPALGVDVSVIWAAPEIARFSSETTFADQEAPTTDPAMRTSIALARFVQDPLAVVATLFDAKRTVARMFSAGLGASVTTRETEETLFRRLSWEMSLWVAGTGVWLEDCMRRPNMVAILQFVPGLGCSKARLLWQDICKTPAFSRAALRERVADLFGEVVAHNAVNAIRVGVPDADDDSTMPSWQPLDQTLIPPTWYPTAGALVTAILKAASAAAVSADPYGDGAGYHERVGASVEVAVAAPAASLLVFLAKSATERRSIIARATASTDYIAEVQQSVRPEGCHLVRGNSEYLFIMDELVAGGQSFLRRPYRRLSTRELMLGVTGVTYVSQSDLLDIVQRGLVSASVLATRAAAGADADDGIVAASLTAPDAAGSGTIGSIVLKEGDYITGTVSGVRGGSNAGIRLVTSRGLDAFISVDNIPDVSMRAELEQHVRFLETVRAARTGGTPVTDAALRAYEAPEWLRRGALVQGVAVRCNWNRCELHLRWCTPREIRFDTPATASPSGKEASSYASLAAATLGGGGGSALGGTLLDELRDSAGSRPRAFTTKISRHVLFRDFNNVRAQEELRDKEIGEMLLRPASVVRNGAVCVVKVGQNCTASWVIREERRFNGSIFYVLKEKLINQTFAFDDVDELLRNYMGAVVALVMDVRRHRRFVERVRDIRGALEDQQRAGGGKHTFAYCFGETGSMLKPPPLYRVFTSCGDRQYAFRLHFTNKAIYVRLPLGKSQTGPLQAEYRWVECRNAEQVSETVKNHARKSQSFFRD